MLFFNRLLAVTTDAYFRLASGREIFVCVVLDHAQLLESCPLVGQHFVCFWKRMNYNGSWIPFPMFCPTVTFTYLWEVSATTVEIRCVCGGVADNWCSRCRPGHRTVSGCEPGTRWAWESPANTRAPCAAPLSPGPTGTPTMCALLGKRLVTSSSSGRWVL